MKTIKEIYEENQEEIILGATIAVALYVIHRKIVKYETTVTVLKTVSYLEKTFPDTNLNARILKLMAENGGRLPK